MGSTDVEAAFVNSLGLQHVQALDMGAATQAVSKRLDRAALPPGISYVFCNYTSGTLIIPNMSYKT